MKSEKLQSVTVLQLQSDSGIQAQLCTQGASLIFLSAPNRSGVFENIAFSSADPSLFAGATVAPVAGRVRKGLVCIDGRTYQMPCNEGTHCLHSGPDTLSHVNWAVLQQEAGCAMFRAQLASGACGLPGNRVFTVSYSLNGNVLTVEQCAESDADTLVNTTCHAYWNLSGNFSKTVYDHLLTVSAQRVWYNNAAHLPQSLENMTQTPFDFRAPRTLHSAMEGDRQNPQLQNAHGYNNAFVLNGAPAAILTDPASGRRLTLETNAPALLLYSGGYLAPTPGCALALEPQSILQSAYPPKECILRAGEVFRRVIRYRFDTV